MARWSKGTNDHDGDGKKGGSRPADRSDKGRAASDPSRSDPAPDPEKEDIEMARTPKSTTTPAPAPAAAPAAPAQPWAAGSGSAASAASEPAPAETGDAGAQSTQSGGEPSTSSADSSQNPQGEASGNGGGTNSGATAESAENAGPVPEEALTITSTDQVPSSDAGDLTGDDDDVDIYDTAGQVEALAENDAGLTGTKELPSFVRDQFSPSGTDVALEADRSPKPPLERSAYPSLGERLYAMLGKADDELMADFEQRMTELAQDVIDDLRAKDVSREFNDRLVDPGSHYGPRVRSDAAVEATRGVGSTNVEANRRARRAAERLAQASKPR